MKEVTNKWIDENITPNWNSSTFASAIDSARKELSGWGTGGRDLMTNPISGGEVDEVCQHIVKIYNGNVRDFRDLVSQLN